jgi:hypothetical protein
MATKSKEVLEPAEALNPSPVSEPKPAPAVTGPPVQFFRFVKSFGAHEEIKFADGSAFSFKGRSELLTCDAALIAKLRDKDVQRKYEISEDN